MNNFSSSDVELNNNTTHQINTWAFTKYLEYQASLTIWKICPPVIILIGVFGNIATVLVIRRIKDHNSSQHVILMSLALSDFTLLCTSTFGWLAYGLHIDISRVYSAACKILKWMNYIIGATSAWLVTCVTVQRTMAVLWPHRMRVMCTVRRTWIVIGTIVVIPCVLYSHILFGFEITEGRVCDAIPGLYREFIDVIFTWLDMCIASLVPGICLFVCDIILSVTLFKAVSSSSALGDSSTGHRNTDSRRKMSYRTTVMVLLISSAFLVLTMPVCVFFIWSNFPNEELSRNPKTDALSDLLYALTTQMWYMNSAINFFLYILTGTKFRREFMSWIRCGAQSPSAPSVHETASEASRGGRHKDHGNSPLSK